MKVTGMLIMAGVVLAGCKKPPMLPDEPHITATGLSGTFLKEGEDSLVVRIDFEDGDGDLGIPEGQSGTNAFLIDSRHQFPYPFVIPRLNSTGVSQAISGSVWFTFDPGAIGCDPIPAGRLLDTFHFDIYVVDQAGHESNRMVTDDVILECQ